MPLGSNLTPPRGSQFYIELYKKNFKLSKLFKLFKLITLVGHWVNNRFSKCNFQTSSCPKLQDPGLSYLVSSSRGPLPQLFKLCHWGQNWPRSGGSQFYIDLYKENFKRHLLFNHWWEFDQTSQGSLGGQSSLNRSSWLHT